MAASYHYVHTHPNIKEANPLLPDTPNLGEFLLQKGLTAPLIGQNLESSEMRAFNIILTLVVLRNHHLYNTTPECFGGANYHVDGTNIGC